MDPANDLPDGAPVDIAITANMAFLRRAFDEVGGFDERYRYGSDTDFGFRLLDAGLSMTCAANARMTLDWGDADRSIKRARYYGRGNVLLFLTHPRRAWTVLRLWPDTIAYPLWILGMIILVPVGLVAAWLPLGWLLLLAFPVARHRRAPDLGSLMRVKLERGVSFLAGWVSVPLHRDLPVLMVPENHENPYLDELCTALDAAGVAATQLSMGPSASQTLNSLLLAPRLTWRRLRGARILHLHWTYPFAWRWASTTPLLRRAPRWWFTALLSYARLLGLRVVYTAHNVLPHAAVFDDDRAARAGAPRAIRRGHRPDACREGSAARRVRRRRRPRSPSCLRVHHEPWPSPHRRRARAAARGHVRPPRRVQGRRPPRGRRHHARWRRRRRAPGRVERPVVRLDAA